MSNNDDLTGIQELSQSEATTPPGAPGSTDALNFPDSPLPAIDAFESMDDFSKSTPPTADTLQSPEQVSAPEPDPQIEHFEAKHHQTKTKIPTKIAFEPPPEAVLDHLKDVSENLPIGSPEVTPSYPFTLYVDGYLKPSEREKLLDLLNKEKMGFREIDLEPQFDAGKIMLPRISEFAGVLIVQALRDCDIMMRLIPSDDFSKSESASTFGQIHSELKTAHVPNEAILAKVPVFSGMPEGAALGAYKVVDSLTSTSMIKTRIVEAHHSQEYLDAVESIQNELRLRAYRKGANAIVQFSVSLAPVGKSGTEYRLTAFGTAIQLAQKLDPSS